MELQSACQAACRWGVTARRVQQWCGEGRIHGACKIGKSWAVPLEAPRPDDGRAHASLHPLTADRFVPSLLVINSRGFTLSESQLAGLRKPLRLQGMAELAYYTGQPRQAVQWATACTEFEETRAGGCMLLAILGASLGEAVMVRAGIEGLEELVARTDLSAHDNALAQLARAVCDASEVAGAQLPGFITSLDFSDLPREAWPMGFYVHVKDLYAHRRFDALLEAMCCAKAFLPEGAGAILSLYLRLQRAGALLNLGRIDEALQDFSATALECQAAGLVAPLGEMVPALPGIAERGMAVCDPSFAHRVDECCRLVWLNWITARARTRGIESMLTLTRKEHEAACLAASGMDNRQVAAMMGVAPSTIKGYLHSVYAKLDIHARSQLAEYLM